MKANGTTSGLLSHFYDIAPGASDALIKASSIRGQLRPYQAAALFALSQQYDRPGTTILEIGTFVGYSAAIISQAAPHANIITLNPKMHEVVDARVNLQKFYNVMVKQAASWEYLSQNGNQTYDMIFVDGDHKRIAKDLPWWEHIAPGGLMLFHDYSPADAATPCPPVYDALNLMREQLGRDFDVCIVDNERVGMVGFYRDGAI